MSAGVRHGRRLGLAGAASCLVAAMTFLVAGCGGVSCGDPCDPGQEPQPGSDIPVTVAAALDVAPLTGWDTAYIEFGEVSRVQQLANASAKEFAAYTMVGESPLIESGQAATDTLGFNPDIVTTAVTLGLAPHSATLLYGSFDVSEVGKKLAAAGFKQQGPADGGTLWAIADNDKIDLQNPTMDAELNVLDVSGDRIVFGGSTAEVEAVARPALTDLARNASLDGLAGCLGGAKAAVIGPALATVSQNLSTYIGIGLDANSAQAASDVLCVTATISSAASSIAAHWTQQNQHGKSEHLNEPWSAVFTDPQSSISGSSPIVVRLTAQRASGAPAGVLLEDYYSATTDISSLIGR